MKLKFNKFLAYSEKNNKYFYTEFVDGVNIVYGKNTSGKSTLIQAILYTFGINNERNKLKEILAEDLFFRLDFTLSEEKFTIIRYDEKLLIQEKDKPLKAFNGIGGDNSEEHKKLKEYMHELFNFTLYLEQKGEYKPASIEAMFLPYYVSQDVGWVYLRKSFSGFEYYKNFKEDFIDYYLGVNDNVDRLKKQELEKELKEIQIEIDFYNSVENSNEELKISKLLDENFLSEIMP